MAGEGQLWHRSVRAATVSVGTRPLADAVAAFLLGRWQAKMSRALVTAGFGLCSATQLPSQFLHALDGIRNTNRNGFHLSHALRLTLFHPGHHVRCRHH